MFRNGVLPRRSSAFQNDRKSLSAKGYKATRSQRCLHFLRLRTHVFATLQVTFQAKEVLGSLSRFRREESTNLFFDILKASRLSSSGGMYRLLGCLRGLASCE
jgi:hypothetical protein